MLEELYLDNISVLLVEDELDTAALFTFLLEGYGAKVAAVDTVAEGFRKAEEIQPDVVISNMRLPDGSGRELLQRLRNSSLEKVRHLPVLAVTGMVTLFRGQTMKEEMRSVGFDAFLVKPVDPDELVELLIEITAGRNICE
jgi:CheY-like chemotaxis protein